MDVDSAGYVSYEVVSEPRARTPTRAGWQLTAQDRYGRVPSRSRPTRGHTSAPPLPTKARRRDLTTRVRRRSARRHDDLKLFDPAGGDSFRDCFDASLIYHAYTLYQATGDESLLRYAYPPMLKTLRHSQFFRPPGSHLPTDPPSNNPPNTWDQIPVNGHGIYNSQLYLLSLQILSTVTPTAMALGVPQATAAVQAEIDTELAAAKAEFEHTFWNSTTGRYRFCDGTGGIGDRTGVIFGNAKRVLPPDVVFLEAFYAQCRRIALDLPPLIDLHRARTHWNNTIDAFLAFKDASGNRVGPPNMLDEHLNHYPIIVRPLGVPIEIERGDTRRRVDGTAAAVHIGRRTGDTALVAKALRMAEAVANQIYDDGATTKGIRLRHTRILVRRQQPHLPLYRVPRPRSVWQLVDALERLPDPSQSPIAPTAGPR